MKLTWDDIGKRFYETGINKGVLYPQAANGTYPLGVAWNGLTAVTESPSGAEPNPLYADNTKYLNLMSAEDFGATIEAYTYPDEFAECDGSKSLSTGVTVGQQTRKPFGLSYKTALGNDTTGVEYGYKLHLVYGATAKPSEKAYNAINEDPDAIVFSWELSTVPVPVTGVKPSAILTINSTKVDATKLAALELILYGNDGVDPRLPLPDEVSSIFASAAPSALAVSSIVPADAATGVAVTASIIITFNNKVLSEAITVGTAAGVLAAITKSWDTTGKILTIAHGANFTASTVHLVTIAGVTDIYAQTLAPTVKKFTTA